MADPTIAELRQKAFEIWEQWQERLTDLPPGTHEITIKEIGPVEIHSIHGSDKRIFIVTENDWVILLHENLFVKFISRYDLRPGMVLQINVVPPKPVPTIIKSITKL